MAPFFAAGKTFLKRHSMQTLCKKADEIPNLDML